MLYLPQFQMFMKKHMETLEGFILRLLWPEKQYKTMGN